MKSNRFSLLTMSRNYSEVFSQRKRVHASLFSELRTRKDMDLQYTSTLAPEIVLMPYYWRIEIYVGDIHPLFNFNQLFPGETGLISYRHTDRVKIKSFAEQIALDLQPAIEEIEDRAEG